MKRNDATFKEMVARLQAGEITKEQACSLYDLKPNTLNSWLRRSKLLGTVPRQRQPPEEAARQRANLVSMPLTPEIQAAMDAAVARVLAGELSARAASIEDPRLSSRTLADKVRKVRLEKGLPVQARRTRTNYPSSPFVPAPPPPRPLTSRRARSHRHPGIPKSPAPAQYLPNQDAETPLDAPDSGPKLVQKGRKRAEKRPK